MANDLYGSKLRNINITEFDAVIVTKKDIAPGLDNITYKLVLIYIYNEILDNAAHIPEDWNRHLIIHQ